MVTPPTPPSLEYEFQGWKPRRPPNCAAISPHRIVAEGVGVVGCQRQRPLVHARRRRAVAPRRVQEVAQIAQLARFDRILHAEHL